MWPLKINDAPFSKHSADDLVAWCVQEGIEFGYKKYKMIYFRSEADVTLFKLRWI